MARLPVKTSVLRALFARSGNQCAFQGCTQPLLNIKNQFIAQVCHIEAAMLGGERFNSERSDEYLRSYENLIILCYPHHIETNDVIEFTVDRLLKIKADHEKLFEKSDFKINEAELFKLSFEMEKYWFDIDRINKMEHAFSDLAMDVSGKNTFSEVMESATNAVDGIENMLHSLSKRDQELPLEVENYIKEIGFDLELIQNKTNFRNPFAGRNWEWHALGSYNWLLRLRIDLVHIEVKYLEEYLKTNSSDQDSRNKLENAKLRLREYAQTATHAD